MTERNEGDLAHLVQGLIAEYLETLSETDGEDIYASYREHARDQLDGFLRWLQVETAVGWIRDLQRVQLHPEDTLVIRSQKPLSNAAIARIRHAFHQRFVGPGLARQVVILDDGLELGVLGDAANAERA